MSGSHNAHAKISPSGLDRTTVCTASTQYVDDLIASGEIPEYEPANVYGASGTFAHDLAEEAILHILGKKESKEIEEAESVHHWLESKVFKWEGEVFQEGYGELENYINYCVAQVKDERDIVYVEVRSKLFYSDNPKDKGTCDFLILHYDGSITIVDLKWRRSGMVESYKNKQLSAYGHSYIVNKMIRKPRNDTPIRITTYNPLVAPYVKPWETTAGELKRFCEEAIQKPIDIVNSGLGTMFVPTPKACLWCPARFKCGAKEAKVVMAFPNTFDLGVVKDEDLTSWLAIKKDSEKFFENVEKRLYDLADKGKVQKGTRLVEGKSNRRYGDPIASATFLKKYLDNNQIYEPAKILPFSKITPKLSPEVKKQFETEYLIKPKGKLKLELTDDIDAPSVDSLKAKLLKSKKRK